MTVFPQHISGARSKKFLNRNLNMNFRENDPFVDKNDPQKFLLCSTCLNFLLFTSKDLEVCILAHLKYLLFSASKL